MLGVFARFLVLVVDEVEAFAEVVVVVGRRRFLRLVVVVVGVGSSAAAGRAEEGTGVLKRGI